MSKYRVHGCIRHEDYVEGLVEKEQAEMFGVYEVQDDGTEQNIADFYGDEGFENATLFAREKERRNQ